MAKIKVYTAKGRTPKVYIRGPKRGTHIPVKGSRKVA